MPRVFVTTQDCRHVQVLSNEDGPVDLWEVSAVIQRVVSFLDTCRVFLVFLDGRVLLSVIVFGLNFDC